jgi:hypothetical protein
VLPVLDREEDVVTGVVTAELDDWHAALRKLGLLREVEGATRMKRRRREGIFDMPD